MLFSKISTRKILNLLGLSLLVTALIVIPSLLELNFFGLPFLKDSVQAQVPVPEVSSEVKIDAFKMTMGALAGLVLFIYGVTRLAEGLEHLAGDRMKNLVSKFTTNRFAGVATGTVATTLLESSSVTIIMTIAMVSAGLLTFAQSLGVVLGSNIGTTIGAQLISLNINSDLAPFPISPIRQRFENNFKGCDLSMI
jgi:phosphate:Na+ symporter